MKEEDYTIAGNIKVLHCAKSVLQWYIGQSKDEKVSQAYALLQDRVDELHDEIAEE